MSAQSAQSADALHLLQPTANYAPLCVGAYFEFLITKEWWRSSARWGVVGRWMTHRMSFICPSFYTRFPLVWGNEEKTLIAQIGAVRGQRESALWPCKFSNFFIPGQNRYQLLQFPLFTFSEGTKIRVLCILREWRMGSSDKLDK